MFCRGGNRTFTRMRSFPPYWSAEEQRHYSFWSKFTSSFWSRADNATIASNPEDPQTLMKALHDNTPSWFFQEQRSHHRIQRETTELVVDPKKFQSLLQLATKNLRCWSRDQQLAPNQIEVMRSDWGDVAQQNTKKHGVIYGILNMANPHFFGGAFLSGGSAQEENMFARTSCSNHIFEEGSQLYIDENGIYRYKEEMTCLINAQILMTPDELSRLGAVYGRRIDRCYKVHMNTRQPEVCFRGPELFFNVMQTGFFEESRPSRCVALGEKDGSFAYLPASEVFPFYEIRSAALDLTNRDIAVDWSNEEFLSWYRKQTKQRTDAQLDTALLNGVRHLVLCAFGCGAFRNPPQEVAKIYRQSIEERAKYFEHIVFAIYHAGYGPDNFHDFERELHGLPLGAKVERTLTSSFV